MENRIIVFTNMKGGVGKSSLCGLFAQYVHESGIPVCVLDADNQLSLFRLRQREVNAHHNHPAPWILNSLDTMQPDEVKAKLEKLKLLPAWILIDCPGNINDPSLRSIYQAADVAVIPINYDGFNIDATVLFVGLLRNVSNSHFIFVPNNIVVNQELRTEVQQARDTANKQLGTLGLVTPRIKQSVVIKYFSSLFPLTYYQRNALKYAFDPIIQQLTETYHD